MEERLHHSMIDKLESIVWLKVLLEGKIENENVRVNQLVEINEN